jgi:antitoxin YefM
VQEREEEVVVTKNGRPAAVLINYAEYERLKETLDVLSDVHLMQQINESKAFYDTRKQGLTFEDVFGEPLTPQKKRRRVSTSQPTWQISSILFILILNVPSKRLFERLLQILTVANRCFENSKAFRNTG